MEKFGYEYGATPRKLEPEYGPRKTKKSKEEFEKLMEPKKMDTEKALKDVAVYCTELNKSRQEKDNISVILLKVC